MIIVSHHDNYEVLKKLNIPQCKVIVIGEKDKNWFGVKNLHFMNLRTFIKKYKNHKYILILDKIDYLDPECIQTFKKQKTGVYSGSHLKSDSILYLAQIMGNIPFYLTTDWHDNYIDKNFLGQTSISDDFIEIFISRHHKHPEEFDFNRYRTNEPSSVIYLQNKTLKCIPLNYNSVQELINYFDYKYLLSGCWYLIDGNKNIINRLYKH